MLAATLVLLLQAGGLTATQSARADDVARRYLTSACSDSRERIGVVTASDGVLHDLSQDGTIYTVAFDETAFRGLCSRSPLIVYHCHPTNDKLSRFPGLGMDGRSSDFGTVAFLEFLCAEEVEQPPIIEHRIVHTGDASGAIIRFGLRGASLERARVLGRRIASVTEPASPLVNRYGMPDLRALANAPRESAALHTGLADLYESLYAAYWQEVVGYLKKSCPDATTAQDVAACDAFSVEEFVRTMEPCADRYIALSGAQTRDCTAATGDRITLDGHRYEGWTEVTPDAYAAFIAAPHALLAFCSDSVADGAAPCATVLSGIAEKLPTCRQLERGFVDVSRYPQLWRRDATGWPEVLLFESGKRYTVNARTPSPSLLKMILCGAETLFEGSR